MKTNINLSPVEKGEIIMYQPDESIRLEVRIAEDTAWLNRQQMALLFGRDVKTIGKHINNALAEELHGLSTVAKFATVQQEGSRIVNREIEYYNVDMILSVGYRVKSQHGVQFRQWANSVLKEYLLRGYAINQRFERLEQRVSRTEEKIDFFVRTALPPKQGVFFDGQIFDAYQFVSELIRSAQSSLVLIDNYAEDSVLTQLTKRADGVSATICVGKISETLRLDVARHNRQYPPVELREVPNIHDRFLLIDDTRLYTFGGSFKDLGKKLFCFNLMEDPTLVAAVRKMIH